MKSLEIENEGLKAYIQQLKEAHRFQGQAVDKSNSDYDEYHDFGERPDQEEDSRLEHELEGDFLEDEIDQSTARRLETGPSELARTVYNEKSQHDRGSIFCPNEDISVH